MGFEIVKNVFCEIVVYLFLWLDLFMGLCELVRGMFLFGFFGIGKMMLVRVVVIESKLIFFFIFVSSLISKYLGEFEKFVRVFFSLVKVLVLSIIFVDEIDLFFL